MKIFIVLMGLKFAAFLIYFIYILIKEDSGK